jgi:hypothetical protein
LRGLGELGPVQLWLAAFALAWALQCSFPVSSKEAIAYVWRWPALPRAVLVASLMYLALLLAPLEPPAFIYFRF